LNRSQAKTATPLNPSIKPLIPSRTLLITRSPGAAWKSSADAISELRKKKHAGLLP
jgi:hypothetical protein